MGRGALALGLMLAGMLWTSPGRAQDKLSGTILAIGPSAQSLTLEAIGAGIRPGRNQLLTEPVSLTAETVVRLVARADEGAEGWAGGFTETALTPADLRTGDYATVETARRGGKLVARSVIVIRPVTPER